MGFEADTDENPSCPRFEKPASWSLAMSCWIATGAGPTGPDLPEGAGLRGQVRHRGSVRVAPPTWLNSAALGAQADAAGPDRSG